MRRARLVAIAVAVAGLSSAGAGADLTTAAQRREELQIVAKEYVDKGPEFDARSRARAHALLDRLARDVGRLSDQQYLLRLAEVPATVDNGHDSLMASMSPLRTAVRLPVRTIWLGRRLFVSRGAPGYVDLAGGEVLRIGRWTPDQLFAALRRYQGGSESYRRWNLAWITQNPALLAAAGAWPDAQRIPLRVRAADGRAVTKTLHPVAAADMPDQPFPVGWLSPLLSRAEIARHWATAGDGKTAPLYLQEPDRYFRMAELPDLDALYVQFRSNLDVGEEKIAPFVASVEERLAESPPHNLILDLRFDTGGDNTQNRELMRDIARKVPGRIFVLAGPYTFSAGIASEAAIIHDGGTKVTVMGEEPGDRPHWWSEHEQVCLPYSKVCVDREMGHWDLIRGCAGQDHCFGDKFDVKIETLAPAYRHALTPAEWLQGKDPLMDEVGRVRRAEPSRD